MSRLTYKEKSRYYLIKDSFFGKSDPRECISKLGKYEDLEDQGLLLILPVALGSIVYVVRDYIEGEYLQYCIEKRKFRLDMLDLIGKKVFLTEEEAVQRIEKLNDTEIIGNATKIN